MDDGIWASGVQSPASGAKRFGSWIVPSLQRLHCGTPWFSKQRFQVTLARPSRLGSVEVRILIHACIHSIRLQPISVADGTRLAAKNESRFYPQQSSGNCFHGRCYDTSVANETLQASLKGPKCDIGKRYMSDITPRFVTLRINTNPEYAEAQKAERIL